MNSEVAGRAMKRGSRSSMDFMMEIFGCRLYEVRAIYAGCECKLGES